MFDDKLKNYNAGIQKYEDENPENKFPLAVPQKYDVVGNYLSKPIKNAYNNTTQTVSNVVNAPSNAYNGMKDASWNVLKKAGFQDTTPYQNKSELNKNVEDPEHKFLNNMNLSQKMKAIQVSNEEESKREKQLDDVKSHNRELAAGYGVGAVAVAGGLAWLYNYINKSKKESAWKKKGCDGIVEPQRRMECRNYVRNNTLKGLEAQKVKCNNNPECIQKITDEINNQMNR